MVKIQGIDEEKFADFSGVVDDLVHEIGNSLAVLGGYVEIYEENLEDRNQSLPEERNLRILSRRQRML